MNKDSYAEMVGNRNAQTSRSSSTVTFLHWEWRAFSVLHQCSEFEYLPGGETEGAKLQSGRPVRTAIANRFACALLLSVLVLMCAGIAAHAAPLRIVAIGASNTHGWYVGNQGAYPAQLEALLRARGVDAHVTNAGVPFETTSMMLRRINRDVPQGTDIVIIQPGSNDLRFFGTLQQRAANVAEMARLLRSRSIKVIVYDEQIPLRYYTFDSIHWTREGHAMIAAALLPRVLATLDGQSHDGRPISPDANQQ